MGDRIGCLGRPRGPARDELSGVEMRRTGDSIPSDSPEGEQSMRSVSMSTLSAPCVAMIANLELITTGSLCQSASL